MLSLAFKIFFFHLLKESFVLFFLHLRLGKTYLFLFIENLLGVLKPISNFLSFQILDNVLKMKQFY